MIDAILRLIVLGHIPGTAIDFSFMDMLIGLATTGCFYGFTHQIIRIASSVRNLRPATSTPAVERLRSISSKTKITV